jgi:DNA-binding transcriptional regulator LsrR (DeoR family)
MIGPDKRKAIFLLHQEGMSAREIARRLRIDRGTVSIIIAQGGQMPAPVCTTKHPIDPELLERLYRECAGWIQ